MAPRLAVIDGPGSGTEIELSGTDLIVGRDLSAGLQLVARPGGEELLLTVAERLAAAPG